MYRYINIIQMKLLEPLVTSNLWETKNVKFIMLYWFALSWTKFLSDSEKVKGCVDLCSSDGVK